jgi:hypothetical protein
MGPVLFFFKKEPKTMALEGVKPVVKLPVIARVYIVLFKKRTKNSGSARLRLVVRAPVTALKLRTKSSSSARRQLDEERVVYKRIKIPMALLDFNWL